MSSGKKGLRPILLTNAKAVLPDQTVETAIALVDGRIDAILNDAPSIERWRKLHPAPAIINVKGQYVLPGLIDIHCDSIEKEVQPRPNTLFPLDMALLEFERKLPLHGITTMYHSLSLGVGLSLRGDHLLTGMVDHIHSYNKIRAIVRNRIHLRYEVSHLAGMPIVEKYLRDGMIDYLSFMDHSPGQGQYREPGSFERYVMKNQGVGPDEVQAIVEDLQTRRRQVDRDQLMLLGKLAKERGITVASHDDDSPDKVEQSIAYGSAVCEFPINMAAAKHATAKGLDVCVGAPNIVRGGSHDKNLRAIDAVKEGAATILCSDYHPSSLLAAVFKLANEGASALPEAVRMASLHPARALGAADELGSIEPGKAADIIVVDHFDHLPWVTAAIVDGQIVYTSAVRY